MTTPTPAVPVFTDGQTLTSQNTQDLATSVGNVLQYTQGGAYRAVKPLCVAYASTAISIPNTTDTTVRFKSVIANTDHMWNGSVDQFVVRTAGWYRISLQLHYSIETAGIRCGRILINGTSAITNAVASDVRGAEIFNEGAVLFCSSLQHLAQGATIYASTWQSSGGAISLRTDFSGCFMSAEWVTPY